jgi:tetratricopeptide (TPR) repeat protein
VKLEPEAMPDPVTPYPPPDQMKTNEELYLGGLRIEQFHAPAASPDPYWQEALRRDPGDVRVNTAMGIDCIKAGRFADAEKYLRTAIARDTDRYTTPMNSDPLYYLGLALKGEDKTDDAFNQFSKASWSAAWRSPAYFEMAEIASVRGDADASLTYCNDALDGNAQNIRALGLKATLLREAGRVDEALQTVAAIQKIDPLDIRGLAEQWLADKSPASLATLDDTVNQWPTTGMELAAEYSNAGLWWDGAMVLPQIVASAPDKSKVSPLIYDYR